MRKTQGLFVCKCGEENADRNAAFNIAYRALGYISKVGVTVNTLRTFPMRKKRYPLEKFEKLTSELRRTEICNS
jgi:transposase